MRFLFNSVLAPLILCAVFCPTPVKAQQVPLPDAPSSQESPREIQEPDTSPQPRIKDLNESDKIGSYNKAGEGGDFSKPNKEKDSSESGETKVQGEPYGEKPIPGSSDILPLFKRLMQLIAEAEIEEAIILNEQLMKINSGSNDLLDSDNLKNISAFLNLLSAADYLMYNTAETWEAKKPLVEAEKLITFKEMQMAIQKLYDNFSKVEKETYFELAEWREELPQIYKKGMESLREQDWLNAISHLSKITIKDPNYMQVQEKLTQARVGHYVEEGVRLQAEEQFDKAEEMFESILKIDPGNYQAKRLLSLLSENKINASRNRRTPNARQENYLQKDRKPNPSEQGSVIDLVKNIRARFAASPGLKKILSYVLQYKNSAKRFAPGLAGAVLILLVIFRFGKIRDYFRKVKRLNANRILYEQILENSPDRRALYPAIASIYRQLKMGSKLPWMREMCYAQLHYSSIADAPLWQLCLGEIYLEFGKPELALKEMEQAWQADSTQEEIREKLEKLYRLFLEQDPENPVWEAGIRNISSPTPQPVTTVRDEKNETKTGQGGNEEIVSPVPPGRKKRKYTHVKTQEEKRHLLRETLGYPDKVDASTGSLPTQSIPIQKKEADKQKPEEKLPMFSKEKTREAYKEIFSRRKVNPKT